MFSQDLIQVCEEFLQSRSLAIDSGVAHKELISILSALTTDFAMAEQSGHFDALSPLPAELRLRLIGVCQKFVVQREFEAVTLVMKTLGECMRFYDAKG